MMVAFGLASPATVSTLAYLLHLQAAILQEARCCLALESIGQRKSKVATLCCTRMFPTVLIPRKTRIISIPIPKQATTISRNTHACRWPSKKAGCTLQMPHMFLSQVREDDMEPALDASLPSRCCYWLWNWTNNAISRIMFTRRILRPLRATPPTSSSRCLCEP